MYNLKGEKKETQHKVKVTEREGVHKKKASQETETINNRDSQQQRQSTTETVNNRDSQQQGLFTAMH